MFGLGGTQTLWHFYLGYTVIRALSDTYLSGLIPQTIVANWFRSMRGRAMGFIGMAFPLGGGTLALAGQILIDHAGWRAVFVVLGAAGARLARQCGRLRGSRRRVWRWRQARQ